MNVLGLIGSARKLGNCEILVKNALICAQEQGAKIRVIRLPEYHLLPCKGCLACVLKGEPCRLDDDMHELWEHLQWADGIILSAPTYFLGPAGIIKLLIDRLFEYSLQLGTIQRRPGAIIATAGLREWDPFTLPMLTMLAGILQLKLIDRFIAYRPGPGEVLLDEETMKRTEVIGKNLVTHIKQPNLDVSIPSPPHACPQCGTPFIQLRQDNLVECQLCQTNGILERTGESFSISWNPEKGKDRWSPQAMAKHFSEWVLRTGPVYQKYQKEIASRIKKFRAIPVLSGSKKA
jgi:multimeric flavodoxin WrbA